MSESENVEILQRAYAAFSQGDIAGLLQMYAPDAAQDLPAVKDLPWTGSWHGHAEMRRFFDTIAQAEEVLDFRQHEFIAQRDRVVVLGTYRARVKATSRVWETPFVHAVTIHDGKIQKFELYFDTNTAAEAYRK